MKRILFILVSLGLGILAAQAAGIPHLLPWPQKVAWNGEEFHTDETKVSPGGNKSSIGMKLLADYGVATAPSSPLTLSVNLVEDLPEIPLNRDEAYKLRVTANKIEIEATTETGIYRAIQTLRQLTEKKSNGIAITGCEITDWPAFRIRGFMQDVGRTYISMGELKREIAALARYKINVFHWHLTENQAWRLQSKRFPMLNDSTNMTRMPGKFYTLEEARELVDFCKRHHVMLIPEIDMPGHSAAFVRAFGHDMQSPEGMRILKILLDEVCETFDVPYLHIGTDEVQFTNPDFVPEMVAYVRSKGKKVISWNPGWHYKPGEIDMTHLWSYRGKAQKGIPAIDSRFHYLNHFDTFADLFALYNSRIYNEPQGSDDLAGTILAVWNDRMIQPEADIIKQNNFYPNMLAIAERAWRGGGNEYFDKQGTVLPPEDSDAFKAFADFENRLLWHKEHCFQGYPFAYVRQTNVKWRITDAFPNQGDLTRSFPPEKALHTKYTYNGKTYGTHEARGAGIYLRHVWGTLVPGVFKQPEENHTAYAWTWVYSPEAQDAGAWIEFQNYSRSEMDLPPMPGKWDYRESRVWLNDREILPPVWTATHREKSNETLLGNENCVVRPPIPVHLKKGWNKVFLKLPVGRFTQPEIRLQKWMFTFVFVTPDGEKAVDSLIYSPDKTFPVAEAKKIKVACVGNSVTYGYGIENRETNSYPAQLQRMLGDKYEVTNFGKSGATLLRRGHRPYNEQEECRAALDFAADRVVIHLGLNDTDPRDWPDYRDDFVNDYLSLIQAFRRANPECRIWICRLTPISHRHPRFKSGTRDWYWQIQQTIEEIASIANTGLIDLQAGLYDRPDLLPDALHPTAEGAGIIARMVSQALTGNYGGLQMPVTYSDNMVLQREKPLVIAGIANAGEEVTVRIAGQQGQTVTGANGRWSVTLPPMQTGGPYTLSISAGSKRLDYTNVLIGEVWLCSGQSNMAFQVSGAIDSQRKELLEFAAGKPQIRLFDMKPRWETYAVEWDASVLDSLNRLQYYHNTGWQECDPATAGRFSAVAFAFGQMLSDSLQVPVGLILNAVGGSPTEAWIDRKTLEFDFPDILYDWRENDFIQDWVRGRASLNIKKSANKQQRHPYEPCYLYESGIQPLGKFPIRGIIWYQGESNAHNVEAHERLFRLLTESWRENWQEELPFYYVQLSGIDRPSWPRFRDSQRKLMQSIPNSGMAVSSDRGDSLDVHPHYKHEIGERLAHWALHETYGHDCLPSGPLYRSVSFKADTAYITFDYGAGMHSADGGKLRTFEIAEHDGLFVPAEARIVDGKTIKVWSSQIKHPGFVRYGWQPFTRANLVNGEGLPASTFRSEASRVDWSGLPDLPNAGKTSAAGVSAPFAGVSSGQLLVAGGCNFPGKPAAEGGAKRYYNEIYALDLTGQTAAEWCVIGQLPKPLAYGASVTTPQGIVWIGGNNDKEASKEVFLINWQTAEGKLSISKLPELPVAMDNFAATYADGQIYVTGGNQQQKPSNALYALRLTESGDGEWTRLPDFPGPARIQPVLTAQQSQDGTRLYLAGGFQPVSGRQQAVVSTDMLSYHPEKKEWRQESILPFSAEGSPNTLTGGCAVSSGNNSILLMGGVNYNRFRNALNTPSPDYLLHPVKWYRFNTFLLQYDTFTRKWEIIGEDERLGRAGAGIALDGDEIILINGELKPGIRTPEVNRFRLKGSK